MSRVELTDDMEWLTVKELSRTLRISIVTIYKLIEDREIPAFKVGGRWQFLRSEITEWLNNQKQEAKRG